MSELEPFEHEAQVIQLYGDRENGLSLKERSQLVEDAIREARLILSDTPGDDLDREREIFRLLGARPVAQRRLRIVRLDEVVN